MMFPTANRWLILAIFFAFVPLLTAADDANIMKLSLQQAIQLALESNLDIAIERIQPEIARGDTLIAKGNLDPKAQFDINYGESRNPRTAEQIAADNLRTADYRTTETSASLTGKTGVGTSVTTSTSLQNSQNTFNDFNDQIYNNVGLSLKQPLLKNFGTIPNLGPIRISRKSEQIAIDNFYYKVEQVVHDVIVAYDEVVYAQANLESRKQSLKLAEHLLTDNQTKLQIGVVSPLDVSQARSEAASRQSDVLTAKSTLLKNINTLKGLITNDLASLLDKNILTTDPLLSPQAPPKRVENIATGLQSRRDYQSKLKNVENSGLQVEINKNQMLPSLDLVTSYYNNGLGPSHSRSFQDTIDTTGNDWTVGFTFQIPWGYYAEKGNLAKAQAHQKISLLELKQTEQTIFTEIDNAYISLKTAAEKIEATKIARLFAEESLKAEEEKLKAGTSTTYTVLQLQRDLANASTSELRALADYSQAEVEMKRAQGLLLSSNNIQIVEP